MDLWIQRCDKCALTKKPSKAPRAPMGSMLVGAPLDRIGMDLLGALPLTPRGNRYIFVVTDYFTKWTEIFAVPDQTAETCAHILVHEVFMRYGFPQTLHSDQGRCFESNIMAEVCELLEIRKTRTTPVHPSCNGQVEKFNSTLLKIIKVYLKGEETNWDKHLGCLAGAYHAGIHDSTELTPNLMMLGREIDTPLAVMFGTHHHESYSSVGAYVAKLKERVQHAHDVAREHLGAAMRRHKELYDQRISTNEYAVGDLVWMETDISQLATAPKLRVPYEGPFMIWRKAGPLDYELCISKDKKKIVHHNKLKPYLGLFRPASFYKTLKAAKKQAEASVSKQS